jgi:hypothetical protein
MTRARHSLSGLTKAVAVGRDEIAVALHQIQQIIAVFARLPCVLKLESAQRHRRGVAIAQAPQALSHVVRVRVAVSSKRLPAYSNTTRWLLPLATELSSIEFALSERLDGFIEVFFASLHQGIKSSRRAQHELLHKAVYQGVARRQRPSPSR